MSDSAPEGYDVIGDIHGCATKLEELLVALGYQSDGGAGYRHPRRQAGRTPIG